MTQRIYYELTRSGPTAPQKISDGLYRLLSDQNFRVNSRSSYYFSTGFKLLLPNSNHYLVPMPSMVIGNVKRIFATNNNAIFIVQFSTKDEIQVLIQNTTLNNIDVTVGMGVIDFAMANLDMDPVKISPGEVTLTHERWGH